MKYLVTHTTRYEYADTVPECYNIIRLAPRPLPHQSCNDHQLLINPLPAGCVERIDFFGNIIEYFSINEPLSDLTVTAKNHIEVVSRQQPDPVSTVAWETIASLLQNENLQAAHFTYNSPHIRRSKTFADYAAVSFTSGRPILQAAIDLTSRIHADFEFNSTATTVSTPVEEVFEQKAGVCQDFAHFQIACLRSIGLPARYVSGYLRTLPPPGKPRLVGADASHAWISLYCGQDGWIDFDPTNDVIPDTDHITLAWGRDYSDVCPIQGVFIGGGKAVLKVSVDVMPVETNP